MQKKFEGIITSLGKQMHNLPQPIHALAVCTGGITVARELSRYLKKNNIESDYFEVWTNTIKGKRSIWKANFKKKDYLGTAVIVEDVIWKGTAIPPIKRYLKGINAKKRIYVVSILDYNRKADFSVFN